MGSFLPWVGPDYPDIRDARPRLLVLGESHYGGPDSDYPEFTQYVVRTFGLERRDRYFTTTAKIVLGIPKGVYLSDQVRRAFWNSVAFYNYIPQLVGPTSRIRPSENQWELGAKVFQDVLAKLEPHMILVLGKDLWYRIVGLEEINDYPALRRLRTSKAIAIATMTNHPSSFRFHLDEWQSRVRTMATVAGFPDFEQLFRPSPNTR